MPTRTPTEPRLAAPGRVTRELRALLEGAPLRPTLAEDPPEAPADERSEAPRDPWQDCGWYDSSWSLLSGLQVRECASEEWGAAGGAASAGASAEAPAADFTAEFAGASARAGAFAGVFPRAGAIGACAAAA